MKVRVKVITTMTYEVDIVAANIEDAMRYAKEGFNTSNVSEPQRILTTQIVSPKPSLWERLEND